ncbi:hypothetical protein Tco_0469724 [Tanacetum coccineum]
MEDEFYNLTVNGNDLKPYVRRFQELAVICPSMVPNTEKLLEAFIGGLPRSIEGNVTASKPQSLEEAINISQRLRDVAVYYHFAISTFPVKIVIRRKPLEFEVGDLVLLKVSLWKGVIRLIKKGKLAPSLCARKFSCAKSEKCVADANPHVLLKAFKDGDTKVRLGLKRGL